MERIERDGGVDDLADERRRSPVGWAGADPTRRAKVARTKVLVAVAARPDSRLRPCVPGELVWLPPGCAEAECGCLHRFAGCSSRALTPWAGVVELVGVGRSAVRAALRAGMCTHCIAPAAAERAADRLLRAAAAHEVGALLARDARGGLVLAAAGSSDAF
jgi:hypothetical protein